MRHPGGNAWLPVMTIPPRYSVLMVCTGNICRSPTADGLLRHALAKAGLAGEVRVDSAGTHDYHVGDPPDPRSCATAKAYGVDLTGLRARQVAKGDFAGFDLILAMDEGHLALLQRACPPQHRHKIKLYLDYAPQFGRIVPDPYYGGGEGFEAVYRMCVAASRALVEEIRSRLHQPATGISGN